MAGRRNDYVHAGGGRRERSDGACACEHDEDADEPALKTLTGGDLFTGEVDETTGKLTGVLDADIINNAGVELPETGGIGTTIFYAIGGLLVVAAMILLVTKKRMATAE